MNQKVKLIFTFIFALNFSCFFGQNFQTLNNLPPTNEVRAPVFNTLKTYHFKVDSVNNNLIIQDLRSSKNGEVHFYQWLYEIPLEELDKTSFKVSKNLQNELQLVISTRSNSILKYMFQNGKVITISAANKLNLGKWDYTADLSGFLKNNTKAVSNTLPVSESDLEKTQHTKEKFKYIGNKVQTRNAFMDDNLSIGNGYYLGQMENINFNLKKVRKALNIQNIDYKYPIPIIIYVNKKGDVESIFIGSKPYGKHLQIDLTSFKPLTPLVFENKNVPAKYIFLMSNN